MIPASNSSVSYGDSCLNPYGAAEKEMSVKESAEALHVYFAKKGLNAVVTSHMGRFVKADIYRNNDHVDSIILDRKTGKMRSIY